MGIRQTFHKKKKAGKPKGEKQKAERPGPIKNSKFSEESEMKKNINYLDPLIKETGEISSKNLTESEMTESEDSNC